MMEILKSDEKKKLTNNQANNQTYLNMEFIYSNDDNSLNMDTVYVYGCLSIKKIFFSLSLHKCIPNRQMNFVVVEN